MNKKLLKGVRVLDFSRILVGAYSSLLLADLGAEVIKIEPPNGDETRTWGPPFRNKDSVYFLSINRNKKSIGLDLKKDESKQIVFDLIAKSDIILENFPSGKMKKFDLDYIKAKEINDKIIYVSVNSYGNKGPMKTMPTFDLIIQAYCGLMNITGDEKSEPFKVGYAVCDIMAGIHIFAGILTAIIHKQLHNEGQYVNTSLLESNIFAMPTIVAPYLNEKLNYKRRGNDHPNISPYTVFKLKSDNYIAIGVATDFQFEKFCKLLSFENKYNFEDYKTNKQRIEKRFELKTLIQNEINFMDEKILIEKFKDNNIPYSIINSMKELFENNQQIEELNLINTIQSDEYGILKYIRNPITYTKTELENMKSPPTFGKDTNYVLKNYLNYNDHYIKELFKNKIVF